MEDPAVRTFAERDARRHSGQSRDQAVIYKFGGLTVVVQGCQEAEKNTKVVGQFAVRVEVPRLINFFQLEKQNAASPVLSQQLISQIQSALGLHVENAGIGLLQLTERYACLNVTESPQQLGAFGRFVRKQCGTILNRGRKVRPGVI